MMVGYGALLVKAYENEKPLSMYNTWYSNGGVDTLRSYEIVKLIEGKLAKVENHAKSLERFKDDMTWMKNLPLYIELEVVHPSGKPVVVSHAPIDSVWNLKDDEKRKYTFKQRALTNRQNPHQGAKIFNIFGHTPRANGPDIQEHYVNVDTGCYIEDGAGLGKLCAYCVETGETVCVKCTKGID
ncbi:MAG: hypothetical protein U9Q62_05615, partial [Campylobacterota bacterium]|nr:hypothetical protein [Campylobacterota bacterium]